MDVAPFHVFVPGLPADSRNGPFFLFCEIKWDWGNRYYAEIWNVTSGGNLRGGVGSAKKVLSN